MGDNFNGNDLSKSNEIKGIKSNGKISMFVEPVCVGTCPLCGAEIYSENDPSVDPTMCVTCSVCEWWENQFLTWEEISDLEVNRDKQIMDNKTNSDYINLSFNKSQLVLLRHWINSMDLSKSLSHLDKDEEDLVNRAVKDFYEMITDALVDGLN